MRRSAHDMGARAEKALNVILRPFGRCRIKLGDWTDNSLEKAVAAIETMGGEPDGQGGFAYVTDEFYFRLRRRRVTLTSFEYGSVWLYGPTKLVRELAAQIAA